MRRNPFEPPTATVADVPSTQINTAVLAARLIGTYVALNFAIGFVLAITRLPGASFVWLVTVFIAAEIVSRRIAGIHGRSLTAPEESRFTLLSCLIYFAFEALNQLLISRFVAPAPLAGILGRFFMALLLQLTVIWLICRFHIPSRVAKRIAQQA
jgi:hypothetical protein